MRSYRRTVEIAIGESARSVDRESSLEYLQEARKVVPWFSREAVQGIAKLIRVKASEELVPE